MTTIKLFDGDLGSDEIMVRCDLSQASSPIEVNYRSNDRDSWESTQYQCADARHRVGGLVEIGKKLAAVAVECGEDFDCESEVDG